MTKHVRREATGPIDGRMKTVAIPARDYVDTTIHVDRPCRPYVGAEGQRPRCEENRGGDFYTDCETCLTCDIPHEVAPDLMAYVKHPDSHPHCVFTRQPRTPAEIERAIEAMVCSEVCGIRYGGNDPEILRRIAARPMRSGEDATDAPLPPA